MVFLLFAGLGWVFWPSWALEAHLEPWIRRTERLGKLVAAQLEDSLREGKLYLCWSCWLSPLWIEDKPSLTSTLSSLGFQNSPGPVINPTGNEITVLNSGKESFNSFSAGQLISLISPFSLSTVYLGQYKDSLVGNCFFSVKSYYLLAIHPSSPKYTDLKCELL